MVAADPVFEIADESHLAVLLPLVRGYHEFEQVPLSDDDRIAALAPLLQPESHFGRIWLIRWRGEVVGYGALCFGYSIEFRGRDAFVDELFIVEAARGNGLGGKVLESMKREAAGLGIVALHLEVGRNNHRARKLYEKHGFRARDQYHLMSCELAASS